MELQFSVFLPSLQPVGSLSASSSSGSLNTFEAWTSSSPFSSTPLLPRDLSVKFTSKAGDFEYDSSHGKFNLSWASLRDFETWFADEQARHNIELLLHQSSSGLERYLETRRYVCARKGPGGRTVYVKKHPERKRDIPCKRTNCPCTLVIKRYHGVPNVLGKYDLQHNHPLGLENVRFTRISRETRLRITEMVENRMKPEFILKSIHSDVYSNSECLSSTSAHRDEFVTRADIRRIEKALETRTVRLHADDGRSIAVWVSRLQKRNSVLSFKTCLDLAPPGSGLAADVFCLIIQTPSQRQIFAEVAHYLVCIDGTHNTTQYDNTTLFTLVCRDRWGHGIPVAWMIASNGTEATLTHYLQTIKAHNPHAHVTRFMSDKDWAQINACRAVFPDADVFLCWWHVLKAWRQHFSVDAYPELWQLLKTWLRATEQAEFNKIWSCIQSSSSNLVPESVKKYLALEWLPDVRMWSAVFRVGCTILEKTDTNMLVEAWHHVLKGTFLENKRNRRLDHLIYTLVEDVVPYYLHKHRRRAMGFEGEDLELSERKRVIAVARDIPEDSIDIVDDETGAFLVHSQSRAGIRYEVDMEAYTCTCPSYPLLRFCKHLQAIHNHFEEFRPADAPETRSIQALDWSSTTTGVQAVPLQSAASSNSLLITIEEIRLQLQSLAIQSSTDGATIPAGACEVLQEFRARLGDLMTDSPSTASGSLLPQPLTLPSRGSYSGDFQALPQVKQKRKARLAYGETSGKKAKPDARISSKAQPPQAPATSLPYSSAPMPTYNTTVSSGSMPSYDIIEYTAYPSTQLFTA